MTFDPGARLDPSEVLDVRGRRMGGGVALGAGGGTLGLILIVAYLLLGGNPSDLGVLSGQAVGGYGPDPSALADECQTGAQANERDDCRIVGYVDSVQAYWTTAFQARGQTYVPAQTVFFSDAIQTGCGTASAASGPFYCPADRYVYIDLGFFEELRDQYGAQGGPLAQGYVIAHEYGHHVQDLLGLLSDDPGQTGATGRSVRTELQADCFAGVWAAHAAATGYLEPLTDGQIADALDAAAAVGDDRIQAATSGSVDPDTWTHGSAAQRQRWFTNGYRSGDPDDCDTFDATDL